MMRSLLFASAVLLAGGAGFGVLGLHDTRAGDLDAIPVADLEGVPVITPHNPAMRVISSDRTSRFMWLGINKQEVIEFSHDISEVLIASKGGGSDKSGGEKGGDDTGAADATSGQGTPDVVKVVVLSNRRINIIGVSRGRTNVYVYDVVGREIGALDIAVVNRSLPPPFDVSGRSVTTVRLYRGGEKSAGFYYLACTSSECHWLPSSRDDTDTALATAQAVGGAATNK